MFMATGHHVGDDHVFQAWAHHAHNGEDHDLAGEGHHYVAYAPARRRYGCGKQTRLTHAPNAEVMAIVSKGQKHRRAYAIDKTRKDVASS